MNDDEMAQEESNNSYLREHPAEELGLWQEWVLVVCRRSSIPPPTGAEWDQLTKRWHHGKAPIQSVDELKELRRA